MQVLWVPASPACTAVFTHQPSPHNPSPCNTEGEHLAALPTVAVLFSPPAPFVETSDGTQTNTVFLTGLPNDTTEDALKGALSGVKPSFVIGG